MKKLNEKIEVSEVSGLVAKYKRQRVSKVVSEKSEIQTILENNKNTIKKIYKETKKFTNVAKILNDVYGENLTQINKRTGKKRIFTDNIIKRFLEKNKMTSSKKTTSKKIKHGTPKSKYFFKKYLLKTPKNYDAVTEDNGKDTFFFPTFTITVSKHLFNFIKYKNEMYWTQEKSEIIETIRNTHFDELETLIEEIYEHSDYKMEKEIEEYEKENNNQVHTNNSMYIGNSLNYNYSF